MPDGQRKLDLSSLRLKLASAQGKRYWRSLEELAGTPEFEEMLHREFPQQACEWLDGLSRRNFLKVMAASLALAGLMEGCTKEPQERIVPYVRPPANVVPGRPLFFASAMPFQGRGLGVVVTSREGRPIKIEGNPDHPESLGATNLFMQASLLSLYDPDRAKVVIERNAVSTWSAFQADFAKKMAAKRQSKGAGLRILTETITSPTLLSQLQDFVKSFPEARWHRYDPVPRDDVAAGANLAFGRKLEPLYNFDKADVVLSLDADFLYAEPGHLRYARKFIDRRRIRTIADDGTRRDVQAMTMNRLYVAEPTTTITGAMADHRLPLRASLIAPLAAAIAKEVGAAVDAVATGLSAAQANWAAKVARDLAANKGKSLVIPGQGQPAEVHALAHAINAAVGNIGQTVSFIEPLDPHPDPSGDSIRTLAADMKAGKVDTLLILGGNPVYDAPADVDFLGALQKVNLRIHLAPYNDETGFYCHWQLPEAHYLEAWADIRNFDGSISVIQPLIAPLYQSRSAIELMALVNGQPDQSGYEVLRKYWLGHKPGGGDFENWWKTTLQKGVIDDSAAKPVQVALNGPPRIDLPAPPAGGANELIFRPDPNIWDGHFANNGWLQELPRPISHLSWDNAAQLSPRTAEKFGVGTGDVVTLASAGRSLDAAVLILPGHADDAVTLTLGYGRTRAGHVGGFDKEAPAVGFNAYQLRTSEHPLFVGDLQITKTDRTHPLVLVRDHQSIDARKLDDVIHPEVVARAETHGEPAQHQTHDLTRAEAERDIDNRKLVRVATLAQFKSDPYFAQKMDEEGAGEPTETEHKSQPATGGRRVQLQFFPEWDYTTRDNPQKHRWAMTIDTNACIGCNACVLGCQSENNIPVVGKDQVSRGREMHWIRIDTYFAGSLDDPETYFEPVPCMHCENAPCELVCPVSATVHDDEGINNMVYNRCVGTRYCSNNCPYKVRRFNFLQYEDPNVESLKLMRNPEVTVRSRGVMEKCTYCIQRINNTRIDIEKLQVRLEDQIRDTAASAEKAMRQATSEADRVRIKSTSEADQSQLKARLQQAAKRMLDSIETACMQACPTEAILFGDLNDPASRIARAKQEPHDFGLLEELTTKPRTTYLARFRNPNPEMESHAEEEARHG